MLRSVIDFGYGILICWFLNLVQLGIAFLLLATSEKALPSVYVLTTALGLVQIGYVVPIYRLLGRRGKPRTAQGLLTGAAISAIANAGIDYYLFGSSMLHVWR